MPDDLLEHYIVQHINATPGSLITFSWHGGEPTLLGLDYFRKIVAMQRKHQSTASASSMEFRQTAPCSMTTGVVFWQQSALPWA